MNMEEARTRVNGSMLPSFSGKGVTLLGTSHTFSQDGMSFYLTASDGQDVQIVCNEPVMDNQEGLVLEVHGSVTPQNTIQCYDFITFPKSEDQPPFDAESYNRAISLAHQLQDHYQQKTAQVQ